MQDRAVRGIFDALRVSVAAAGGGAVFVLIHQPQDANFRGQSLLAILAGVLGPAIPYPEARRAGPVSLFVQPRRLGRILLITCYPGPISSAILWR